MRKKYTNEELNRVFQEIDPEHKENKEILTNTQLTIIRSVLSGKDTLNILPTGSGKSACFQVPAMLLPGITIVISPLLSLIEDQVRSLFDRNIPVACITNSLLVDRNGFHYFDTEGLELSDNTKAIEEDTFAEEKGKEFSTKRQIRDTLFLDTILAQNSLNGIGKGNGYKILYMTPERLRTGQFIRFATRANISMIAVDEAHCISLWGYEFRRRYLEVMRFIKRLPQRPIVAAFTATATDKIKCDIIKYLSMEEPIQYIDSRKRTNLKFSVHAHKADKIEEEFCRVIHDKYREFLKMLDESNTEEEETRCSLIRRKCHELVKQFDENIKKKEEAHCQEIRDKYQELLKLLDKDNKKNQRTSIKAIHENSQILMKQFDERNDEKATPLSGEIHEKYQELLKLLDDDRKNKEIKELRCREVHDKYQELLKLLDKETKKEEESRCREIRSKCQGLMEQFDKTNNTDCILIYCLTVKQVQMYYKSFQEHEDLKGQVVQYYAALDSETKQDNWEAFLKNEKRIMISTNALGMGVDKKNIRYVIHAGMPMSLENYYQEAGRAARVRNEEEVGFCSLYYMENDVDTCLTQINSALTQSNLAGKQKDLRQKIMYDRLYHIINYCDKYLSFDNPDIINSRNCQEDPQDYIVKYFNGNDSTLSDPEDDKIEASFYEQIKEIDVLIANRTKIAQLIRKGQMSGVNVPVGNKNTVSYEITVGPEVYSDEQLDSPVISYLDMMVADAVYTLFIHGRSKIYARQIWELLTGCHDIMLSTEKTREINNSLRKLSKIKIRINMSNSVKMGFFYDDEMDENLKPISVLEGAFLPLKEERGGFIRVDRKLPPLYQYAEIMHGEFHAFDLSLMKVIDYDSLSNDGEETSFKRLTASWPNVAMTHYLLRIIDPMRRKSTTPVIKLDTMTSVLNEFFHLDKLVHSSPYGRKIREIQSKENLILKHFKKQNYISGFDQAYRFTKGKLTDEPIPNSIRISFEDNIFSE